MPDISDIVGEVVGEFSKLGKSVTSQITGSDPVKQSKPDFSVKDQAGGFGKSLASQLFGSSGSSQLPKPKPSEPASLSDELKKFGTSLTGQLSGSEDYTNEQISEMTKRDDTLSQQESETVRTKIAQIYQEYAAKKKKEQMMTQQQAEAVEEQKQEIEEAKKQQLDQSNPAIAKTRAEIKNYGAE